MQRKTVVCHSCGRELEHKPGCVPCEELTGWITISIWKGKESVDHFNFCCFGCLRDWIENRSPRIPNAFLQAFGDETDIEIE